MPERSVIVFDLDGTLSDPSEGVVKSLHYVLERLERPRPPAMNLMKYIGPPLPDIFSELLETTDETLISEGIRLFRQRYLSVGYGENRLYPGIPDILERLKNRGYRLYVATVKRTDTAVNVVKHLGIPGFFEGVYGCDFDTPKVELLRRIRRREDDGALFYMVGDRGTDIEAGLATGMRTIGVAWGFGSPDELKKAEVVVTTPDRLMDCF